MIIRIGTRGSPLALAQANETGRRLVTAHGLDRDQIEIVRIATTGDRVRDRPLAEIGGKGLFTKELEEALRDGAIDCAVHSMKDMPALLPEGLVFAAVLPREDPRDAFISLTAASLHDLPQNAVLGSSSVRRTAQALRLRPDLQPVQFRGNVETRLRKLQDGVADATFLAMAGLIRLGLADKVTSAIPIEVMLPAIAQGAIAIETSSRNTKITEMLAAITHPETARAVACERAFLAELDGSCRTPIAGHALLHGNQIEFQGEALTPDGKHVFAARRSGSAADAEKLGADAGRDVRSKGGNLIAFA